MNNTLIGRQEEQAILNKAFQSGEPEMVAVIGRRRVGKTFFVRSVYEDRINFERIPANRYSSTCSRLSR